MPPSESTTRTGLMLPDPSTPMLPSILKTPCSVSAIGLFPTLPMPSPADSRSVYAEAIIDVGIPWTDCFILYGLTVLASSYMDMHQDVLLTIVM